MPRNPASPDARPEVMIRLPLTFLRKNDILILNGPDAEPHLRITESGPQPLCKGMDDYLSPTDLQLIGHLPLPRRNEQVSLFLPDAIHLDGGYALFATRINGHPTTLRFQVWRFRVLRDRRIVFASHDQP